MNVRLSMTRTGIGKPINIRSVTILSTPKGLSVSISKTDSLLTERDQLYLSPATGPRIGHNLPIEVQRSTFQEGDDLDHQIADRKHSEKCGQGNPLPAKIMYQMTIKIEQHQLLKP